MTIDNSSFHLHYGENWRTFNFYLFNLLGLVPNVRAKTDHNTTLGHNLTYRRRQKSMCKTVPKSNIMWCWCSRVAVVFLFFHTLITRARRKCIFIYCFHSHVWTFLHTKHFRLTQTFFLSNEVLLYSLLSLNTDSVRYSTNTFILNSP